MWPHNVALNESKSSKDWAPHYKQLVSIEGKNKKPFGCMGKIWILTHALLSQHRLLLSTHFRQGREWGNIGHHWKICHYELNAT